MLRVVGLYFFLLIFPLFGYSQKCFYYHKDACGTIESKYAYSYNQSSVSYLFKAGESRQIPFTLYAGKDYRITICTQNIFDNIVSFKIVKSDGTIFYDNSKYDFEFNLEFSSRQSQEVILELEVPDMPESKDSTLNEGCVGILIEDMISVKTGF